MAATKATKTDASTPTTAEAALIDYAQELLSDHERMAQAHFSSSGGPSVLISAKMFPADIAEYAEELGLSTEFLGPRTADSGGILFQFTDPNR